MIAKPCLIAAMAALGWLLPTVALAQPNSDAVESHFRLGDEFTYRTFEFDGVTLSCAVREGTGPTLLLIPGTFSDSRVFAKIVPDLDASLNLLIVENRGLGRSWPPPVDGSIEQCARDALRIASRMTADSFYIGGHSLGGMISLEVGRTAPEKIRGIVSIEGWTSWHAARDAFDHDMKSTLSKTQLRMKSDYRAQVLKRWTKQQEADFSKIWRRWDGFAFLNSTQLPILEMYGDRGKARPSRAELRIPTKDNIELKWFEGSSHSLLIERPRGVADAINHFIERVESTRQDH